MNVDSRYGVAGGFDGLRGRKKRRNRELIAHTAARLFRERGYDNVSISDIAAEADVAPQTIYNYFPTKERLVLDEDRDYEEKLLKVITDARSGRELVVLLRILINDFLNRILSRSAEQDDEEGLVDLIAEYPNVRRHWLEMCERHSTAMAQVLATRANMPRAAARVTTITMVAPFIVILDEIAQARRVGSSNAEIVQTLRPDIELALQLLERSLKSIRLSISPTD